MIFLAVSCTNGTLLEPPGKIWHNISKNELPAEPRPERGVRRHRHRLPAAAARPALRRHRRRRRAAALLERGGTVERVALLEFGDDGVEATGEEAEVEHLAVRQAVEQLHFPRGGHTVGGERFKSGKLDSSSSYCNFVQQGPDARSTVFQQVTINKC